MKKLFIALCAAALACAQEAPNTWEIGNMSVPTSSTNFCNEGGVAPLCSSSRTLHVNRAGFVNTNTTGSVTVTILDGNGNALFSAAIAGQVGGTTYTVDLGGKAAPGGATWSATGAGVTGWVAGN
jgi:hypothetical protein